MTTFDRFSSQALCKRIVSVLAVGVLLMHPSTSLAGGYDIPIINTARYGGQGGTGIGFVDGGTSLYLNPAGLGRVGKGNIDLAVTVLAAKSQGTPTFLGPDTNVQTRGSVVFPFGSGAVRATKFMTLGVAAYIVGGSGGSYIYPLTPGADETIEDATEVAMQESTLGIAFNVDKIGLNIGGGYRVTFGRLDRSRPDPLTTLDLQTKGVDLKGFRVGFQWQPNEHFAIGGVYRNKITIPTSGNSGSALGTDLDYVAIDLILPGRTGGGIRLDWGGFGTAVEFEWIFNSQNDVTTITTDPALPIEARSVFDWSDQWLIRWGGEYGLFDGKWPVRLGFVFGSTSTSAEFPNAFGPPPAPEYLVTFGTGYEHGPWQLSFAYARAFSSTLVDVDTSDFLSECPNCGGSGQYELKTNHFLFDFSYNWR